MTRKKIYLVCLITYLIIIFSIEFVYRDSLYEKSVEYIESINQEGFLKYFYLFWTMIYLIGVISVGLLVTLFAYPLNIFFCHISFLIFAIFIMCLFKSLYTQERPFWDIYLKMKQENKTMPKPTECDSEFGNPSGHCVINMYSLFLWHLFISSNFINSIESRLKKNLVKYLSLGITLTFMFFVAFSRVHRQMHSFNQIIHGTAIGFAQFFIFCYIFEYNKMSLNDFILFLNRWKFIIIPIILALYVISIVFGLTLHNDKEDEYQKVLIEICGFDENYMFGKSTAFVSSIIFMVVGGCLGFLYMNYKNNKNNNYIEKVINNWNKGKFIHSILIILFSYLVPGVLLVTWAIPYSAYVAKFIIVAICICVNSFLTYGPCFCFACEKFKKSEVQTQESLLVNENKDQL